MGAPDTDANVTILLCYNVEPVLPLTLKPNSYSIYSAKPEELKEIREVFWTRFHYY